MDAWAELACSMFFTLDYIFIPTLVGRRRIIEANFATIFSYRSETSIGYSRYGVNPAVNRDDFPRYYQNTKTLSGKTVLGSTVISRTSPGARFALLLGILRITAESDNMTLLSESIPGVAFIC